MSRHACATSCHGTWPDRARRDRFRRCACWRTRLPAARIASPIDRSSMFMWKVSSRMPHAGMIDPIDDLDRLRRQVDEAGLEPVQRLDPQPHAAIAGVARQLACSCRTSRSRSRLPLVIGRLPRAADRAVERTDHVRRAHGLRGVDAVPDVVHPVLPDALVGVNQIAVGPHRRADADASPFACAISAARA